MRRATKSRAQALINPSGRGSSLWYLEQKKEIRPPLYLAYLSNFTQTLSTWMLSTVKVCKHGNMPVWKWARVKAWRCKIVHLWNHTWVEIMQEWKWAIVMLFINYYSYILYERNYDRLESFMSKIIQEWNCERLKYTSMKSYKSNITSVWN